MNRFEVISIKQCSEDLGREYYENIKLPKRATKFSAGYDFYAPYDIVLNAGETLKIPTGIRIQLDNDKVLICAPRSGLGFKYRLQLDNTIGVVDSDYYNSDNEGHIFLKVTNDGHEGKQIVVKKGEAFAQGIILQYFTTVDDDSTDERNGGFGSTTKGI